MWAGNPPGWEPVSSHSHPAKGPGGLRSGPSVFPGSMNLRPAWVVPWNVRGGEVKCGVEEVRGSKCFCEFDVMAREETKLKSISWKNEMG